MKTPQQTQEVTYYQIQQQRQPNHMACISPQAHQLIVRSTMDPKKSFHQKGLLKQWDAWSVWLKHC